MFPNIVDEQETKLLSRKGGATMAIFKSVTVAVVLYCAQAIYRGQTPDTVFLAYLAFAGTVLGIFTGGNAVEHMSNKGKKAEAPKEEVAA